MHFVTLRAGARGLLAEGLSPVRRGGILLVVVAAGTGTGNPCNVNILIPRYEATNSPSAARRR
jgi:hypothetical protein